MKKRIMNAFALVAIASISFVACDTDYGSVGQGVINASNFETGSDAAATVKIYNHELQADAVRTDNLPVLMLGKYTDPLFGDVKANYITQLSGINFFGEKSADEEAEDVPTNGNMDENEQVVNVRLVLPFYSTKLDTDSDGITTYELDSIFGAGAIDIKVYEQTEFLRRLDPSTNFESDQKYYADHVAQYNPTVLGSVLNYMPSSAEKVVYERDADYNIVVDGNGDDVIEERLEPQLEITLDTAFFQSKLIAHEGEDILTDPNLFQDYLRGLYIEASNAGVLLLTDPLKAKLIVSYKYTKTDGKGTVDTADDETEDVLGKVEYRLGLKTITTYNNTINAGVQTAIQNPDIANGDATVYLKGTVGSEGIIELFTPSELAAYRANDWLVNGASLDFYVDNANAVADKSYRIYLYDYENQEAIIDFYTDQSSSSNNPLNSKFIYGGILLNDANEFDAVNGTHYKINLTEHINRIFNEKDDAGNYTYDNVKLGLKVMSNPAYSGNASEANPLGVVLVGSNTADAHKIKLQINYTKLTN